MSADSQNKVLALNDEDLRRAVCDLIALSTLPAAWSGRQPESIAADLADAVLSTLRASLVHVHFQSGVGQGIEIIRLARDRQIEDSANATLSTIAAAVKAGNVPAFLRNARLAPANGLLPLGFHPIGPQGEWGTLIVGSTQPDFPGELDNLLIGFAANQAAVSLNSARLLTERQHQQAELRRLNATLEERIIERSRYLRLLQEIAAAANEATSLEAPFQFAVDQLCAHQNWSVGHAYFFRPETTDHLDSLAVWYLRDPTAYESFQKASESLPFRAGQGLIGRIVRSREPVVIEDIAEDRNFVRAKAASAVGLKSAVAFPVLINKEVAAVLEFFCDQTLHVDDAFFEVMASIGNQLGRVIERKRAEKKLRESERLAATGEIAAVFAHEVGNPLNAISTTMQLLRYELTRGNENFLHSALEDVSTEVNRLQSLLRDFRSLSRSTQFRVEKTDLAKLAREVLATGVAVRSDPRIRVIQEFDFDLPSVMYDCDKMKQVLINLCKNAVEAMPEGGILTVRGKNSAGGVQLEIADTGAGIPATVKVFQPFTTTKPEGTGLGLAIVRQIIDAHGGTIFYSSDPGKGTSFYLSLPPTPPLT
ncbi:MAG: ATP-binding protein [Candidatus Binatia bacterium]